VNPTALVTGASSGIGRAFCGLLSEHGYDLLLVARRRDLLDAVATDARLQEVEAEVFVLDLTEEADAAILTEAISGRPIDVLVNAAGLGDFGPFVESDWETQKAMIDLNVTAFTRMLYVVARSMARRGGGRILNVASVASFQPGPLMSVYYATKAYDLWLSEAVAEELVDHKVTVTALCPGPTRTPFHRSAGMDEEAMAASRMPTTREVAEFGYRAMMRGRRVAVYGLGVRLMIAAKRLLPRRLVSRVVGAMQKRRLKR
jgi:short-subunit dehydrogenase